MSVDASVAAWGPGSERFSSAHVEVAHVLDTSLWILAARDLAAREPPGSVTFFGPDNDSENPGKVQQYTELWVIPGRCWRRETRSTRSPEIGRAHV